MESPTSTSRKELHFCAKTLLHFSIFFTMGFIAAFMPWDATAYILDRHFSNSEQTGRILTSTNLSVGSDTEDQHYNSTRLVIVITTTQSDDKFHQGTLIRLAHSLANVPPPLLWLVVEAQNKSLRTTEILRGTRVMYRHLMYKENFTDPTAEKDHQRNIALRHIEQHQLSGMVLFSVPSIIYSLKLFKEIRKIKSFGAWPVASVGLNRRKVIVEGPICEDSKIVGWFSKDISSRATQWVSTMQDFESNPPKINIFGFGFDSSILWDPNRSSGTRSMTNTTEGFIKFVLEEATKEDGNNLKGIPSNCSKIMLWQLNIPKSFVYPSHPKPNL
ncbi:hypothetical protein LUZ60_009181 [Juncus effusus]|nr:hypothetical protein LUZ60_009181 [Juncus effusus]